MHVKNGRLHVKLTVLEWSKIHQYFHRSYMTKYDLWWQVSNCIKLQEVSLLQNTDISFIKFPPNAYLDITKEHLVTTIIAISKIKFNEI